MKKLLMSMILVLGFMFFSLNAQANAKWIFNTHGDKCQISSVVLNKRSNELTSSVVSDVITVKFKNKKCMKKDATLDHIVNFNMIASYLTREYSHSDANFNTRNLYDSAPFLKEGVKCMQSRKYPNAAVAIKFEFDNNDNIVAFKHSSSLTCDK